MRKLLILVVLAAAAIAAAYVTQTKFSKSTLREFEGTVLQSELIKNHVLSSVESILKFKPSIMCVSVGGLDPRTYYLRNFGKNTFDVGTPDIEVQEGSLALLFVGENKFYIERFDHNLVWFDVLPNGQCHEITNTLSIKFGPPSNRVRYSKFSGEIKL